MSPRGRSFGRAFAVAAGLGYAIAAGAVVQRAFVGEGFLRSFRWPLYSAEAAILSLIALMILAGATMHTAGLAVACTSIVAIMIAKYDSESGLAPLVGVSTALLVVVYARAGLGSIRLLPAARAALLFAAAVFAVIAILRMEDPHVTLDWQRLRLQNGTIELRTFRDVGTCLPRPPGGKDVSELGSGCSESIPVARAGWVIGLCGASGALIVASLAGVPRVRHLSDGTPVPLWM